MKKFLSFLFIAALFPGRGVSAMEAPKDTVMTAADLVELAIRHTMLLGAQDARIEEKRLSASQARVWPGFAADLLMGRRREAGASGPRYEFSLAQPLPLTGKPGLRGALLDLEAESWRVRRAATERDVTLAVAQGAYEYAANRRKAAFAERRRRRFELMCAQHETKLGGESPLRIQVAENSSEAQGSPPKADAERSVERKSEPTYRNRIRGVADRGERAYDREAPATKGRRRRFGGCGRKAWFLTWGGLALCLKGRR